MAAHLSHGTDLLVYRSGASQGSVLQVGDNSLGPESRPHGSTKLGTAKWNKNAMYKSHLDHGKTAP